MARRTLAFLGLSFVSVLAACGSDAVTKRDYGYPPDAAMFDPGNGSGGDGYDSGSTPTRFVCPDELKKCAADFTYPFNGESSVELRGDYGGASTRG